MVFWFGLATIRQSLNSLKLRILSPSNKVYLVISGTGLCLTGLLMFHSVDFPRLQDVILCLASPDGRSSSDCSWALACVLLTALLFVFINVNFKDKSGPVPLLPSPTLLPILLWQRQSPTCTYTKSQPFCFHQIPFSAGRS